MTTWKPIERAPNYEVSSDGQVRRSKTGKLLTPVVNIHGYPVVCLRENGRNYNGRIHKLVAWAFLGTSGLEVNHKNGNKLDNRVENLEYINRKGNAEHAAANDLYPRGSEVKNSRLIEADIRKIWEMRDRGAYIYQIAEHFGVSIGCICWVLKGETWRRESEALGRLSPRASLSA